MVRPVLDDDIEGDIHLFVYDIGRNGVVQPDRISCAIDGETVPSPAEPSESNPHLFRIRWDPENYIKGIHYLTVSYSNGLYTANPKTDPDAELIRIVTPETLDSVSSVSDVDDVTGGVRNKMESMLRMCGEGRECVLINGTVPGRLLALLRGEDVTCTVARM